MSEKILKFDIKNNIYLDLADKKIKSGKVEEAISLLYPIFYKQRSPEIAEKIANIYAQIKNYDLSNMYWFFYLDKVGKGHRGNAYYNLGVNAFYCGNLELTSFYFQKKVDEDGFIDRADLPSDMLQFLINDDKRNKGFRIVYPPKEADNKQDLELAKKMLNSGNVFGAKKLLNKIGKGSKEYWDALLYLAEIAIIDEDFDSAISFCDEYMSENSDHSLPYLIKVSVFLQKKDFDKAEYYFNKAISIIKEDNVEAVLKAGACSAELKHHSMAEKYFTIFLKAQPFHIMSRFYLAISLLNQRKLLEAKREFVFINKLEPDNVCFKFYLEYVSNLILGKGDDVLPVNYQESIPNKFVNRDERIINSLFVIPIVKVRQKLNDSKVFDAVCRGIKSGNNKMVKNCETILSGSNHKGAERVLFDCLLDEREFIETKKSIAYSLIATGYKKRFSISIEGVFISLKPQKFNFEKTQPDMILPYAYCMAKLTLEDESAQNKIGLVTKKVVETVKFDPIKNISEISALIANEVFAGKVTLGALCDMFHADIKKTKQFIELYLGIKNVKE